MRSPTDPFTILEPQNPPIKVPEFPQKFKLSIVQIWGFKFVKGLKQTIFLRIKIKLKHLSKALHDRPFHNFKASKSRNQPVAWNFELKDFEALRSRKVGRVGLGHAIAHSFVLLKKGWSLKDI